MPTSTNTYLDIELSTEVESASSHRLIQLLIDKCMQHLLNAKNATIANDLKHKNYAITRANNIVGYLRACLNLENDTTKELATQLDELYAFMENRLLYATLKNQSEYLEQAEIVLSNIKAGWDGIAHLVNKEIECPQP